MRLLLLADGEVGRAITSWLIEHHAGDLALVVTTADNDIASLARSAGLDWAPFTSSQDLAARIAADGLTFDLGLLAWWPSIIREPLLSLPAHGLVNTHPSLLPHNRGKHYNFWALVEQCPFGVSLHLVDAGVDTGDVLFQLPIAVDWTDTGGSLYRKATAGMISLVKQCYPSLRGLQFERQPQGREEGSFHRASELDAASRIDLDGTYRARDLFNLVRARTFPGHPACTFTDGPDTFEVRIDIKRKSE